MVLAQGSDISSGRRSTGSQSRQKTTASSAGTNENGGPAEGSDSSAPRLFVIGRASTDRSTTTTTSIKSIPKLWQDDLGDIEAYERNQVGIDGHLNFDGHDIA